MRTHLLFLIMAACAVPAPPAEQDGQRLQIERADFARWLATSPSSPYAAVYHQLFADELSFGPGGHAALTASPPGTLSQGRFRLTLETADGTRTVPRNRDVPFGEWRLRVSGPRRRAVVTVFAPLDEGEVEHPGWYPYDASLIVEGVLERPERRETRRMLGLDGVEVEASWSGTFVGRVASEAVRLMVYRVPEPGTEEAELSIFFRDGTSGETTYPPGRFVTLQPLGGDRYRVDFNRTRNPFCAYTSVFPCPLPWRGNTIEAPIEAGELYAGGGLEFNP